MSSVNIKHSKIKRGFAVLSLFAVLAFFADAAVADGTPDAAKTAAVAAQVKPKKIASLNRTMQLIKGKADTIDLGRPVADVLVADPSVADVGTLRANRLYIVGKEIGDTNVLAFDAEGNRLADITVRVRVDELGLRDTLHEFFPDEDIAVRTVKDEVILSGRVSTPGVANQVRDLAGRFVTESGKSIVDLMNVSGEQQVMLRVRVLEANRSVLREYGISTAFSQNHTRGSAGMVTQASGLTQVPFGIGGLILSPKGKFGPLEIELEALERDGLVSTLAEPNLTAISGETAGFLAGGEYPIPVSRDRDGNITLEFKQFGVSLNFTPTVLSEDQISLQLATEVSDLSQDNSFVMAGTTVRGLSVRRADTTVQLGSGGTIMIAGLIRSGTIEAMNGMPGVKDIPILGELFKSKSFTRNESELVILVTPYVVKPFADSQGVQQASVDYPVYDVDGVAARNAIQQLPVPDQTRPVARITPTQAQPVSKTAPRKPLRRQSAYDRGVDDRMAGLRRTTQQPQARPQPQPTREMTATAAAAPIEQVAQAQIAPPPRAAKTVSKAPDRVLSQAFSRNLSNIYGARAAGIAAQAGNYGYIVD